MRKIATSYNVISYLFCHVASRQDLTTFFCHTTKHVTSCMDVYITLAWHRNFGGGKIQVNINIFNKSFSFTDDAGHVSISIYQRLICLYTSFVFTHLSHMEFPLLTIKPVLFRFKGCWMVFCIFIQISWNIL